MDERRENDRDFPIDARIAGRSRRFCSRGPLARRKHQRVNGTRGQVTNDPRLHLLRVIYGGHYPPWLRVGQSFPWIGTPMTVVGHLCRGLPAASGLAASARETARGQSRLRHGKVIFATSTLRR
jgi:hypothetical protein